MDGISHQKLFEADQFIGGRVFVPLIVSYC
jgi:hypothetical protein